MSKTDVELSEVLHLALAALAWFVAFPATTGYYPAFSFANTVAVAAWLVLTPVGAYLLARRLALRPARLAAFVVVAYLVAVPIASGLRVGFAGVLPLWPSLLLRTGLALASVAAAVWLAVRLPVPRLRGAP